MSGNCQARSIRPYPRIIARLEAFWAIVDHVLTNDPTVRKHFYGRDAQL